MIKWENYECEFSTLNTENAFGNSRYYVWKKCVLRDAPINRERGPSQVNPISECMTYLDPASDMPDAILNTSKSVQFLIMSSTLDFFEIKVFQDDGAITTGRCYKIPQIGWHPFDFDRLSHSRIRRPHIGHEIIDLVVGRPSKAPPFTSTPTERHGEASGCCVIA